MPNAQCPMPTSHQLLLLWLLLQALPPKVKSIGPCADPPHEMYVVRFDLNQASQLCTFAVRTYAYTRAVGIGHWALGIGHLGA